VIAAAPAASSARVDAWLWAVRVTKTRSAATAACRAGHVRVNGERAKAAQPVRAGDEVRVRIAGFDRILVVKETLVKRVSPALAATAYLDSTPALPEAEKLFFAPRRERGAGRPTKRERRELEQLRDRERPD
jgi:ribosome-associated heat shock protein Hsp15